MQVPERILFFLCKMSVSLLITLLFPNIFPGTEFYPEDTQPVPAEPPAEHKETVNLDCCNIFINNAEIFEISSIKNKTFVEERSLNAYFYEL